MFWQALSERVTDQCACQDNSEDDKTNDQRILHNRVSLLERSGSCRKHSSRQVSRGSDLVCSRSNGRSSEQHQRAIFALRSPLRFPLQYKRGLYFLTFFSLS